MNSDRLFLSLVDGRLRAYCGLCCGGGVLGGEAGEVDVDGEMRRVGNVEWGPARVSIVVDQELIFL